MQKLQIFLLAFGLMTTTNLLKPTGYVMHQQV